jgi:hypothetical protein
MPQDDKKKKSGGLLNDLAMGLGLKDRDESYYHRTAKTIQRNQGGNSGMNYYNKMLDRGLPQRGGLFAFMSGGNQSNNTGGNNVIPRMFGYRDTTDMFDRGGRYASGGLYQDGGGYSVLANIGAALSGQDMGERQTYADQAIDAQYGQGFSAMLKQNSPQDYMRFLQQVQGNM